MNADGKDDVILVVFDTTKRTSVKSTLVYYMHEKNGTSYSKRGTIEIDDVEYLDFRNVTNDSIPEILVHINSGGTSETASKGLEVYQLKNDSEFVMYRSFPYGEPELWESNGTLAVLLHDRFSGIFAKSESAVYVDSVCFFEPNQQADDATRRLAVLRDIELKTLREVDTLAIAKPKDADTQRAIFSKVVNRVMILKKLNRNREADDYARAIIKKNKYLSRPILDALDELRTATTMPF